MKFRLVLSDVILWDKGDGDDYFYSLSNDMLDDYFYCPECAGLFFIDSKFVGFIFNVCREDFFCGLFDRFLCILLYRNKNSAEMFFLC